MLRPMMKWVLASVFVVGGAATLVSAAGCSEHKMPMGRCGMMGMSGMHHTSGSAADPAATTQPAAKPVNSVCPIMGGKVNPSLTRQFKGQTVGFCCGMCPGQWDKLNDQEKQAKIDKVLGK